MPDESAKNDDYFYGPVTTGLRLIDLIRQSRSSVLEFNHSEFRDVFWLKGYDDWTIFRCPMQNGEFAKVAFMVGLCKHGDDFCCQLEKDQSLPALNARRDFPCGCACVCVEMGDLDGLESCKFTTELLEKLVESQMREGIERLQEHR